MRPPWHDQIQPLGISSGEKQTILNTQFKQAYHIKTQCMTSLTLIGIDSVDNSRPFRRARLTASTPS